jgi:hypothetical protein
MNDRNFFLLKLLIIIQTPAFEINNLAKSGFVNVRGEDK